MPAKVSLESAGDHGFDMPHLKRSGAEDLIQLLLEKAGFYQDALWRVRVNEKQQCSGMTPPISVIRYKEWGVYVRIKPGDNNTCHNVTLLIPTGFKSESVFGKLKAVEKAFNRNWRKIDANVSTIINKPSVNGVNGVAVLDPLVVVHKEEEPPVVVEQEIVEVTGGLTSLILNEKFDVQVFLNEDAKYRFLVKNSAA